jgi:hypothetical protein
MPLLDTLLGGGLLGQVKGIIGSFKLDPEKKAEMQAVVDDNAAKFRLAELDLESKIQEQISAQVIAQIAVNEADAKGNWYQSGWRPSTGYVCVIGLLYEFLIQPLLTWGSSLWSFPGPPKIDLGSLLVLLMGMLGLGAMRTSEKLQEKD